MIAFVDTLLNRITMYRLVLYYLIFLLGAALALALGGALEYDPYALLFSIGFLVAACQLTNIAFARAYHVPSNVESAYITALILALIITPIQSPHDLWFLGWSAVLAMASKYILAIKGKHLFNPAALAVALTALTLDQTASWWVGSAAMLPFVLVGGLVLARKLRRFDLIGSFFLAALATILAFALVERAGLAATMQRTLLLSPLLFFGFVIVTEPLTAPPTRALRVAYGAIVGVLFTPQFHLGGWYTTPELAILIGNLFAYLVSPKAKLMLTLNQKVQIAPDIYDFTFAPARKLAFAPGQYMEWTLGHDEPDSRGNRRYFTLASSPTEDLLRLGVKFYQQSSSFKQALLTLDQHHEIAAGQLGGDFVLPDDPRQKCVFIAGGIGITPFRSMIKYLLDTHQRRQIVLFYANRTAEEIVYQDVFEQARWELGIKTIYSASDPRRLPRGWNGHVGRISAQLIQAEVPDYQHCLFYVSGPPAMVEATKQLLSQMHVPSSRIKTDLFAGLA
jgi:ferredoxin-NADP reductase/Na+-translocating ferredoxin:NAD+ oxidoreductase RnfD subunit